MAGPDLVEVVDVDVVRSGRMVLRDVNFRIDHGEFTGLIGSNGAGKTTLLRVLLGLQDVVRGHVLVHGVAMTRSNSSVGYVPQKVLFEPDVPVRVRDFVALGVDGHRFGFARRTRRTDELVDEMLDSVEATSFANRRIGSLSGGEQQRVLIAHALVSKPELLLLDEPLANLDPGSAQEIIRLLHDVVTRQHVAILLSAHEMNPLLPVMDRVVYVANGRVASGTTDQVIQPEVLSALYGHHVDVLRVHGRVLVVAGDHEHGEPDVADHPALVVD
ncbi:MAG: metal ABC transporter ATP-binding protein [Acidimicrobiales bacterium]